MVKDMRVLPRWARQKHKPVWYVSYGSNMAAGRFMCYIRGGRACGSTMAMEGASDRRPPMGSSAVRLDRQVYFAGHSKQWGGGVCLLDHERVPVEEGAFARAWLITRGQLDDVISQENGTSLPTAVLDLGRLEAEGTQALGTGRYQTAIHLGDLQGHPMVSFTAPWTLEDVKERAVDIALNGPSTAYAAMIAGGLGEVHAMSPLQASRYLESLEGHDAFEEPPGEPEPFWVPGDLPGRGAPRTRAGSGGYVRSHRRTSADGRISIVRAHRRYR